MAGLGLGAEADSDSDSDSEWLPSTPKHRGPNPGPSHSDRVSRPLRERGIPWSQACSLCVAPESSGPHSARFAHRVSSDSVWSLSGSERSASEPFQPFPESSSFDPTRVTLDPTRVPLDHACDFQSSLGPSLGLGLGVCFVAGRHASDSDSDPGPTRTGLDSEERIVPRS